MLNIIKEKLDLSPDLKKKINWASKYTSTSITLEKGNLIRLEPTNLAYVDSHKVIINDIKFLFFNGVDCFYINSLNISFIYVLLIQKHCLVYSVTPVSLSATGSLIVSFAFLP